MPDHAWLCPICGEKNPPYTEVCRECGVAAKANAVRITSLQPIKPNFYRLAGFGLIAYALWDLSDRSFCESLCGNLLAPLLEFLYLQFGHWGPRLLLISLGLLAVLHTSYRNTMRDKTK
jgi:hypothetical protein